MNNDFMARAELIFRHVVELPVDQRATAIEKECAKDAALQAMVSRLLACDEQGMEHFLRPPANGPESHFVVPAIEDIFVDRYHLVRCIGQGGMGRVFLARQVETNREVALKILRSDLSNPSLLGRFKREIEALGHLNHPSIATLHDAGTTDGGISWFAMEYVPGLPLKEFVQKNDLPIKERLGLIIQICEAVHYANREGVLHRDLKPANILVVDLDPGNYQVKILDFGVAQLSQEMASDFSVHTLPGQLLGTLAYMSPEQATGETQDMDPRADVYQLGVILFELLTGQLPLEIDKMPVSYALKQIQEQEPAKLGTLDISLRGDLEIITAKAMAKEPQERYSMAGDLGADIKSYLAGEPIVARPTTSFFRTRKRLLRSRRTVLALFAVAIVSIAAGWLLFKGENQAVTSAPQLTMLSPPVGWESCYLSPVISPDGTQMAMATKKNYNLVLRSVSNQEEKILLPGVPDEFETHNLQWHPSGEKLLLTAIIKGSSFSLRWFDLASGEQQTILNSKEFLRPVISPDGKSALIRLDAYGELAIIDLETSEIKTLARAPDAAQFHTPVWGPHGKRVAYVEAISRIYYRLKCMDLQGESTTLQDDLLLKSSHIQPSIVWLPDGRLFYGRAHDYTATETDLWQQPMADGSCQAAGEARLAFSFSTLSARNFTYSEISDRLLFSGDRSDSKIALFEVGASGGLKRVDLPQTGWPSVPMSFVNDGRHLVIRETRSDNNTNVFLQDIFTGQFKPLLVGPEDESPLATSVDGKYLFRYRKTIPGNNQMEEYYLWSHCLADSQDINLNFQHSDDDYAIWISSPVRGGGNSFMFNQRENDLVVRELSPTEGLYPIMLALPLPEEGTFNHSVLSVDMSHDADKIAYLVNYDEILVYDLARQETTTIPIKSGYVTGVRWSIGGKWLFIRGGVTGEKSWIARLELETGNEEILWESPTLGPSEMWISLDGNYISCKLRGGTSAVGMLEGL